MTQQIDVLASFEAGSPYPRPVRFKLLVNGVKKAVDVSEIRDTKQLGAGGMSRIEYDCVSPGYNGPIEYTLMYYFQKAVWEIEIKGK